MNGVIQIIVSNLITLVSVMPETKRMTLKVMLMLAFGCLFATQSNAQQVAVKTNLLYGGYTYTPNLSLEIGLSNRSTLEIGGAYNWFNRVGSQVDNKKLVHSLGQIEYRYWLCSKFSGHFFGVHALGSQFNIAGHELPLLFGKGSKNYRYEGYGVGGGISYGYSFFLGNRWSLEAQIGVGYAWLHYDKYDCVKCGKKIGTENRNYFGPTKAGISLIYIIK